MVLFRLVAGWCWAVVHLDSGGVFGLLFVFLLVGSRFILVGLMGWCVLSLLLRWVFRSGSWLCGFEFVVCVYGCLICGGLLVNSVGLFLFCC